MVLDRLHADDQLRGDLPVRPTRGREPRDLLRIASQDIALALWGERDPGRAWSALQRVGRQLPAGWVRAWTLLVTGATTVVFFWRAYG